MDKVDRVAHTTKSRDFLIFRMDLANGCLSFAPLLLIDLSLRLPTMHLPTVRGKHQNTSTSPPSPLLLANVPATATATTAAESWKLQSPHRPQ